MPSVRSVALGFWIGTGSAAEAEPEAGLSHLIEHMLFRGTARFESVEIDQIFDGMGAELNAGTGKETTSVYSRVLDVHLERALDVMADMVWRPRFAQDDLDNEREIVLEEIAMYEDDPQDKVFDVLGEAVFGSHPLGRAIIGRAEVVAGTPADGLRSFYDARYVPRNVVGVRGGVARPRRAGRADRGRGGARRRHATAGRRGARRTRTRGASCSSRRRPSSTTCASAARGSRATTTAASRCACWTTSSAARRPRGSSRRCARSAASRTRCTRSSRCTPRPARSACTWARAPTTSARRWRSSRPSSQRFRREPATLEELERSKENVKGRLVLALESTTARMNRLGSSVLAGLPLLSVDEMVERIDAVTVADLEELAAELYAPEQLSAAGIGADRSVFDAALEPLGAAA